MKAQTNKTKTKSKKKAGKMPHWFVALEGFSEFSICRRLRAPSAIDALHMAAKEAGSLIDDDVVTHITVRKLSAWKLKDS